MWSSMEYFDFVLSAEEHSKIGLLKRPRYFNPVSDGTLIWLSIPEIDKAILNTLNPDLIQCSINVITVHNDMWNPHIHIYVDVVDPRNMSPLPGAKFSINFSIEAH